MASRTLIYPEDGNTLMTVSTRFSGDLPGHIKGRAYWVSFDYLSRSQYHVTTESGHEFPVELVNNYWHILRWDEQEQRYYTKHHWKLPIGEYGTGWYHPGEPGHPDYQHLSPLEARVTSDPESTPTTESPQDRIDESHSEIRLEPLDYEVATIAPNIQSELDLD
jgi:hypothetical protein